MDVERLTLVLFFSGPKSVDAHSFYTPEIGGLRRQDNSIRPTKTLEQIPHARYDLGSLDEAND